MDLSLGTTGYVGLGNSGYVFENDVYVTATFSPLENMTFGNTIDAHANTSLIN
jgi:hypothetical protein